MNDRELRSLAESLLAFDTTDGEEAPAQTFLGDRLADLGFETVSWTADPERLAAHPSFPDDPTLIETADRPSVAGVLDVGDPDAGPTVVLNGHVDVVPAGGEGWTGDPFEPRWEDDRLVARGAADMKAVLTASVAAALDVADRDGELNGRIVVESVVGEEAGGIGTAAATLDSPYDFERDAALIAEQTGLTPVVACEGSLMMRLALTGRSAHAATPWRGESVLPHFETIRRAFADLERGRHEQVTHPLYEAFPTRWPVVWGTVEAGSWPSTVADRLSATVRIGVAPGETVDEVEAVFEQRLAAVVADDEWLSAHPPTFERFDVQFEPSAIDPDEPVVAALREALADRGLADAPRGATYGTDARHFAAIGVPAVVFGPGDIEQAHFPDESVAWSAVRTYRAVVADAVAALLLA